MLAGACALTLNTLILDATMAASRWWLAALVAPLTRLQREPMPIDLIAIECASDIALGAFGKWFSSSVHNCRVMS